MYEKTQTVCLILLTVVAVGASLIYLQSVLLPFVIALFVVIGCRPISEYFQLRLKLHHLLAFGLTFFLGLVLLAVFGFFTWASVQQLAENREMYEKRIVAIASWIEENFPGKKDPAAEASGNGTDAREPATGPTEEANKPDEANEPDEAKPKSDREVIRQLLNQSADYLRNLFLQLAGSLSSLLSYGILILIFVFFLLLGDSPSSTRPELLVEIEAKVRQYLVMKTVISAVTGLAFGLVLWLFNVPLAIVFGVLAFLLNYIPNIGPLISSLTPVPFLVLNSEMSMFAAITCFLLIASIQFVSGNVIETKMMGKSFDVSPIILLLALMFFGQIWGIVGMFLAPPIVSIIKIILEQRESTKALGELMAGRLNAFVREASP